MSKFVTFGEIMARLSTPGYKRFQQAMPGSLDVHFGGAEASVAALIANWGGDASYVTSLPDNPLGRACLANLRSVGVSVQSAVMTAEGRIGLYFVEHGVNQRSGQVIYDRADSVFSNTRPDAYDWNSIFAEATWFVFSGITPAISCNAADVTQAAIDAAKNHGVKIACDMNFRNKLWQWRPPLTAQELAAQTMPDLVSEVDLLVCGRGDAVTTLGIGPEITDQALPAEISKRFPSIERIVMTRRESVSSTHQRVGASLYDVQSGQTFHAPEQDGGFEIADVVDRIGTGDAMTAALLFALETPGLSDPKDAILFATAAGCLAHSIEGDISYIDRSEVEWLMNGSGVGRINR